MKQFRKGDIVTIECCVEIHFTGNDMRVRPVGGHADIYVGVDQVKVVRHVLEAGDHITNTHNELEPKAEVLAAVGDRVWVKRGTGGFDTWYAAHCRRVELEEAQVAS